MINRQLEKRLFDFCVWFMAGVILLLIMTSCNPYAGLQPGTPTGTRIATKRAVIATPSLSPSPTPAKSMCIVQTGVPRGYLNLRTGAGVTFAVIRILAEGEVLTVIERAAWLQVIDAQDNHGFINSKYCR